MSWHLSHRWVEMPGRRGCFRIAERGRTRALWWYLACTARGVGATGRDVGVLHGGRGLVQYAQPLASAPRASCSSRPENVRGRGPSASCDARASRCPSSGHGRIRSRCAWWTSLEFCGSYSACGGSAAFMSAHGHLPPARRPCPCLRSHDPKGLRNEGTRHGEARSRPDGCRLPEHGT